MTADADLLLCAWCGEPLNQTEATMHMSYRYKESAGWHPGCYWTDDLPVELTWTGLRVALDARGPGRVKKLAYLEEER